jgi:hypothetical protein
MKKAKIYNSSFVRLKDIIHVGDKQKLRVARILDDNTEESKTWDLSPFKFESAVAVTTHRYQGKTIHESKFNIHEIENMSLNDAYTALSRATHVDAPHFKYTPKKFTRRPVTTDTWLTPQGKVHIGGLYKITNANNTQVYYGQVLEYSRSSERFKEHCSNTKSPIDNSWTMEMVQRRCVISRQALERYEIELIQSHCDTAVKCINIIYNDLQKDKAASVKGRLETAALDAKRTKSIIKNLKDALKITEFSKKRKGHANKTGYRIRKRQGKKTYEKVWLFSDTGIPRTKEQALKVATEWRDKHFLDWYP